MWFPLGTTRKGSQKSATTGHLLGFPEKSKPKAVAHLAAGAALLQRQRCRRQRDGCVRLARVPFVFVTSGHLSRENKFLFEAHIALCDVRVQVLLAQGMSTYLLLLGIRVWNGSPDLSSAMSVAIPQSEGSPVKAGTTKYSSTFTLCIEVLRKQRCYNPEVHQLFAIAKSGLSTLPPRLCT